MKIAFPVILNQNTFEGGFCVVDKETNTRRLYSMSEITKIKFIKQDFVDGYLHWIVEYDDD
jgi:hypothetical protein